MHGSKSHEGRHEQLQEINFAFAGVGRKKASVAFLNVTGTSRETAL